MIYSRASVSSLLKFDSHHFLSTAKREIRAFGTDAAARGTAALVVRRPELRRGSVSLQNPGESVNQRPPFSGSVLTCGMLRAPPALQSVAAFACCRILLESLWLMLPGVQMDFGEARSLETSSWTNAYFGVWRCVLC